MISRKRFAAYSRLLYWSFGNAMREYFSVRTRAAMNILAVAMDVAIWGTLAGLIGPSIAPMLAEYGTSNPVTFMLSGIIISRFVDMAQLIQPYFFRTSYKTYHHRPFNIWLVCFIESIDEAYFWRLLNLFIYISLAALLFGVFLKFDSCAFWLIVILGALYRLGLNLFTAGWIVLTKGEKDPITWFYTATNRLLTGELFPVAALPALLQWVAKIHPQTYVNLLARKATLQGQTLRQILPQIGTLLVLATAFLLLGCVTLRVCIKRAKREGTMKW